MEGRFNYEPEEYELEKASNGYIMSLIALTAGLPFPLINLLATLIFYIGNRRATHFVRWHCTQALLSQFSMFLINSVGVIWTILIIFGPEEVNNSYIAYLITVLFYNLLELIATIYAALKTRKGIHTEFWFYGNLTNIICKPKI